MATDPGMMMEMGSSDEEEPSSDFDVAADAVAMELGAESTPGFRRALKEAIMACVPGAYGEEKAPKEESGLALVFGSPKGK